ncbi:uncharacterized protein BDV17DRAFT_205292 [Aspergillus undulatus]|uniref:uncharacterized protein n=1 Tax=Aspergillus undulatus TaxID=1810928 RepID=UPI003CCE417F
MFPKENIDTPCGNSKREAFLWSLKNVSAVPGALCLLVVAPTLLVDARTPQGRLAGKLIYLYFLLQESMTFQEPKSSLQCIATLLAVVYSRTILPSFTIGLPYGQHTSNARPSNGSHPARFS